MQKLDLGFRSGCKSSFGDMLVALCRTILNCTFCIILLFRSVMTTYIGQTKYGFGLDRLLLLIIITIIIQCH